MENILCRINERETAMRSIKTKRACRRKTEIRNSKSEKYKLMRRNYVMIMSCMILIPFILMYVQSVENVDEVWNNGTCA
jgi:hypothetical protein